MSHNVLLECAFALEVGHYMPNFPEGHPNRRIHGHSYQGLLRLKGPIDPSSGVLIELSDLQGQVSKIVEDFDHRMLNEIPGLEFPTTENLARVLYHRFREAIPFVYQVELLRPTLGMRVCFGENL